MFGKKYISLSKSSLVVGKPLLFPVYNKQGALLAEKGTTLTEQQVNKIEALEEVFTLNRALETAASDKESDKIVGFKLPPPLRRLEAIEENLIEVYQQPTHPAALSKILTLINRIQAICEKSPDAALAKIILDDNHHYTVKHVIHTAILCELSAIYLKWGVDEKRALIGAALTMNISMGLMQDELVHQAEKLSEEQRKIIKEHPLKSADILVKMGVQTAAWLECVRKHHEAIDGSGYPQGCLENEIPLAASLVSLADIYCAKVSGRSYRQPIFANVAARDIFLVKDQYSQGTIIEVFVRALGLYPPGCMVRLANDEIGIVVKRGERVDTPVIQVVSLENGSAILTNVRRQTKQPQFAVKSIIPTDSIESKIDYDFVWKY